MPVKRCALNSSSCYIGNDLQNPQAPVHVIVGQGGTGGADHFGNSWAPWTRAQLGADTPGQCSGLVDANNQGAGNNGPCSAGYGRVEVVNSSHLTFEYVLNKNGSVVDAWTIVQEQHGPFA